MLESEPITMYTEEMSIEDEPVFESYKGELAKVTESLVAKIANLEAKTALKPPLYSKFLPIRQAQSALQETRNRLAILQQIDDLKISGNPDGDWSARIHIRNARVIDTIYLMRRLMLEPTWESGYSYPVYSGGKESKRIIRRGVKDLVEEYGWIIQSALEIRNNKS